MPDTLVARSGDAPPPPVILISIDGLRPRALGRGDTPNLDALAARGVRARWMTPSFPTLTFPNHYTLVTGLRPDAHGVVGNVMEDTSISEEPFTPGDRELAADPRWWDGGEPVWVTAERQGIRTATLFWPGSEAAIRGVRPDRWTPFDRSMPNRRRTRTVLDWLAAAPADRPGFVTLYFNDVDHLSHEHGPDSDEARAALRDIDAAIGELVGGLDRLDLAANIVVVSDHGMATVQPGHRIALDKIAPAPMYRVIYYGAISGLEPTAGHETELSTLLPGRHGHMQCWPRDALPERFHFGRNPRVPGFLCLPDVGWVVQPSSPEPENDRIMGAHGYDNAEPSMRAVFIAAGPGFSRDRVIAAIDNTEVAPLVNALLGLRQPPGNAVTGSFAPGR